jgi:hypothetical protein
MSLAHDRLSLASVSSAGNNSGASFRNRIRRRLMNGRERLALWFLRQRRRQVGWLLKFTLVSIERATGLAFGTISRADRLVIAQRGNELLIHVMGRQSADLGLMSGVSVKHALTSVQSGAIEQIIVILKGESGFRHFRLPRLLAFFRRHPDAAQDWLEDVFFEGRRETDVPVDATETIRTARANEPLIDFLGVGKLPFEELMPSYLWAEPKKRSAVLLNNCYYYYEVLAAALRRRGWEVRTASFEPPDSPSRKLYWNKEEIIYDPDPIANRRKAAEFFNSVAERFGAIQLYGQFQMSCFRENWSHGGAQTVPWDFLEMRRRGIVIGYTPSGCSDGGRQSSIRRASTNACQHCVWENQPSICSDELNGGWAQRLDLMCDWIGLENDYAVDERTGPRYVRRPVVTGLDPSIWKPDLEIPEKFRIHRNAGELLVYHAFANSQSRGKDGRGIKGSDAVIAAVERLQHDGVPVKLFYATDIPTTDVRFFQVQADIVVDQLHYGRIGSNAREALMLGRPLLTRIDATQSDRAEPLDTMATLPFLSADANTIYDALLRLAGDPDMRREMGRQSREYALRWHSDDVCAARFEKIVDRIRAGLPADLDEYPDL